MTLLLALISFAQAEPQNIEAKTQEVTYIDFSDVELTAELTKPSVIFVAPIRQPAKPDLLIPDVRQLFLDKEAAKHSRASK
tara:strand:+ start:1082 stop:1324 length:243 start_codon:yes stop_codon:yes gene_type:complete